jgi:hypothetical protein
MVTAIAMLTLEPWVMPWPSGVTAAKGKIASLVNYQKKRDALAIRSHSCKGKNFAYIVSYQKKREAFGHQESQLQYRVIFIQTKYQGGSVRGSVKGLGLQTPTHFN